MLPGNCVCVLEALRCINLKDGYSQILGSVNVTNSWNGMGFSGFDIPGRPG
jgi:hypothetical protein